MTSEAFGSIFRYETPESLDSSSERPIIPDVLADRYASAYASSFSPVGKILLERDLWITVMKTQAELGLEIPPAAIEAYEEARDSVDLDWIRQREK